MIDIWAVCMSHFTLHIAIAQKGAAIQKSKGIKKKKLP
jgi:hypothetical protein